MTQQLIDLGSGPDSNTGDSVYVAFTKTNENFTELYTIIGSNGSTNLSGNTITANYFYTTGTVRSGNINAFADIQTVGNVIAGQFLYPNGSPIGGISSVTYNSEDGNLTIVTGGDTFVVDIGVGRSDDPAFDTVTVANGYYVGNTLVIDSSGQISSNSALANSGVTAGTYGNASAVPVFTVNEKGIVTLATTAAVAGVSNVAYDEDTGNLTISTSSGTDYTVDIGTGRSDDPLFNSVTTTANLAVGTDLTVGGTTTVSGNILPSANVTYDIGSTNYRFKDLYLSGNTIYLGDSLVESDGVNVTITNPTGGIFTVTGNGTSTIGSSLYINDVEVVSSNGQVVTSQLEDSGVTAGTYGNASIVPSFTVDEKGRVTAVSNVAVSGVSNVAYDEDTGNLTISTSSGTDYVVDIGTGRSDDPLFNTLTTTSFANVNSLQIAGNTVIESNAVINAANLPDSGVTAGTYGNASAVPVISIDDKGRITIANTAAVAGVSNVAYDEDTGNLTISTSSGEDFTVDIGTGRSDEPIFTNVTVRDTTTTETLVVNADAQIGGNITAATVTATVITAGTFVGNIEGNITAKGNSIQLGYPVDANIQSPGSITDWTTTTTVTDALDDLNEVMENIRNNTYVKSTAFTGTPLSGGEGLSVTLTITSVGNPNRYDIDWGDGNVTTGTSDSTPTWTYNNNTDSPFTVNVRAYNNNGSGKGSEAYYQQNNYIALFTANPVVSFDLYRASSGGTALSGSTLYVDEAEEFWLQNNTTNTLMADVAYTINWGDGNTSVISDDSLAGGVSGGRINHTYAAGQATGTGTKTITVTLTSHTTANPAVIPTNGTKALKIYDPGIAAPNGLSTKTISFSGTVGTSPYLASGYTDNTSGNTSLSAGSSVNRITANSGTLSSTTTSSYAYDGDAGTLTAQFNGADGGSVSLTSGSQTGTYGYLVVAAESDYNLLTSAGSSTSFALSTYTPNLYKGFTTRVGINQANISAGVNEYWISHSTTGNTNTVGFVKDNLTATPVVDLSSATLTEGTAGSYRYISGVPYYNTGSPTVTLSGAQAYNWIGQTYRNTTTPFETASGTNDESTSSSVVSTQYKTYAQIDGASTFLSGGVPIATTGQTAGTAYNLGNVSVALTSSSIYAVETIQFRMYNVNGTGSYAAHPTKIQMFTAAPSGFVEDNISVTSSSSLWNDAGLRIALSGASGANPVYNSSTNYYTDHAWSGAETIAGTDEAVVRWNQLKHFATDLSSGYLPVGPDLATGRSGTQYFRGVFRRNAKSSITVTFTGKISGLWIALPGSTIDSTSGLNGWIDATSTYNGSGVPGSNTGAGGNGTDGCALGTTVPTGSVVSGSTYTLTFGTESTSNAYGNQILFSIALASGDYITSWSFG